MKTETINKIVLNNNNELILLLDSNGEPMYQYVYREAAGVYWDDKQKGFKSTPLKEWTVSDWFFHIKDIGKSSLSIDLKLNDKISWENIPETEQTKIKNAPRWFKCLTWTNQSLSYPKIKKNQCNLRNPLTSSELAERSLSLPNGH